jgi:light-regulated signal transduction histidine kinase (bacteriophytochrome)
VEARLLSERQGISTRHRRITFISLLVTLGLGAALLAWLFRGVRREMRGREKLERQLQQKAAQLEASNKELEGFSYSISHDLRAPLRAIDGFALMMLEDYTDRLDDEGRRFLTVIRENSRRMGALIDDLLSFSRLGRQAVAKSKVDMETLVREVLHEALRGYQKNPPTVEINPLPAAHADRALVRQVWVNLLSNALKYCGKSDRPTITVSGSRTATEIIYEIKDNGVGFNMAYADKLFGVFQRLHRADEFEGTGVGLAIVDRIISRHGGRVWAEGKLNRGATFSFSLPRGDQLEGA